ncbi:MAG: hypothetical protein AAGG50_02930 [Bacteroidota bacterium]
MSPPTFRPVCLVTQGEYDYSAAVEVFADGTVETFRGSYVTRGTSRRPLTEEEQQTLRAALDAVDWDAALPDVGGSLTHRLTLDPPGGPTLVWRDALPDERADLATLVAVLRAL